MSSAPITGDSPADNSHLKIDHVFWLPENRVIDSLSHAREYYDEYEGEVPLEGEIFISNHTIAELLKLTRGDISQAANILGVDFETIDNYVTTTTKLRQVMEDIRKYKDREVLEGLSIGLCAIVCLMFVLKRMISVWTGDIGIDTKLLVSVFTLYLFGGACYFSFQAVGKMLTTQ